MSLKPISDVTSLELEQKGIVAESPAMKQVMQIAKKIAPIKDCPILIWGETGVGKEVIARLIHDLGNNYDESAPFIKVNCGAIPENLLESELFGYEEGAFSGARKGGKEGKFELAQNGTILLDEIGEMPMQLQVKLLQVLQDKTVTRVGGTYSKRVNARVIALTNKDLKELVLLKQFREDLYFRLSVLPIYIPPLRERREDIWPLILYLKNKLEKKFQINRNCATEVINVFLHYDWQGNVRELENVMHRLYLMTDAGEQINAEVLISHLFSLDWKTRQGKRVAVYELGPLKEINQEVENEILQMAFQRFKSTQKVAEILEVDQSTIRRKLQKLNLLQQNGLKRNNNHLVD